MDEISQRRLGIPGQEKPTGRTARLEEKGAVGGVADRAQYPVSKRRQIDDLGAYYSTMQIGIVAPVPRNRP